jgi:ornithine cyclodeaminase/alanine dehydrogenase-like protein (mu-crystallin family)
VAVFIDHDAVGRVLKWGDCIDLLEDMSRHEAEGGTFVSPKFNSDFRRGSMRILFAADYISGCGATKAYHTIDGTGTRYLVSLIDLRSGTLLALVDGRRITDFRTGAASGMVARRVPFNGPVSVGIVGSGHQARAQLECLATVYRIVHAAVFSPTPNNRETFAREMSEKLGITVAPAATAEGAMSGRNVVVAASKSRSREPVVRREWLSDCRLLCAVGNTRPQFVEIDRDCFEDARLVIVDSPHAIEEAGELIQANAKGLLTASRLSTLAVLAAGGAPIPADGLVIFKSVGSALQDLALVRHCYELLRAQGGIPVLPDLHCSG